MKKLIIGAILTAIAAILIAIGVQGAANATPDADNKKVTFCHATGSESNPYVKIETSVMAFYNAGHIDHEGDIWEAFSYVTNKGETVNVPAQGDTSLLAFDDCQAPKVDEKVAKPDVTYADPCGTENDVFAVASGRGYTVSGITTDGVKQTINVTLNEGFSWLDGSHDAVSFEKPVFTNVDCDLPNTGAPEMATMAGWTAVGGLVLLAVMATFMHRRRENS